MKIARTLLVGASLLAPPAWAGEVSNVGGTLDTTLVDPAPAQYPHFICASGCSGGGNGGGAVTQSGAWSVGVSNFPSTQAVTGTVSIGNFPASQAVTGTVSIGNFPVSQAVTGTVSIGNFPTSQAVTGAVSVANLPAIQAITAASLPLPAGAATAASQPALNGDGGSLNHITNFPGVQAVSGSVSIATSVPYGGNHVGSVAIDLPLPGFITPPTFNVGNASLAVTAASGGFSDGWNPTEGSTTDTAWTSGAGSLVSLLKANVAALTSVLSSLNGPTPTGSNSIGSVSLNPSGNTMQPQGFAQWQSSAVENCHAYGSPTTVYSLGGYANQAEWVLVFNASSAPSDGAVTPAWWFYLPQAGSWSVAWDAAPRTMTTGDTVCYSSTGPFTKTTTGLTVGSNSFFGQRQ